MRSATGASRASWPIGRTPHKVLFVMQQGTFAIRYLLLALLPLLNGWLFTGPMWRDANQRLVEQPGVFGVLEGNTSDPHETRDRLLVVRYSINEGEELYATIPLT